MDLEIFRAFTRGYLSQTLPMLSEIELKHLAFSALYITFEQVLRFLEPGEAFNEVGVFADQPNPATAIAGTPGRTATNSTPGSRWGESP